jgi:hypothetical protein
VTLDIEEKLRLLQTGPEGPRTRYRKRKNTTKKSETTRPSTTTPSEVSFETLQVLPVEEQIEQEVVFRPNPGPQEEFLAATEPEVLYGGAAGGELKS